MEAAWDGHQGGADEMTTELCGGVVLPIVASQILATAERAIEVADRHAGHLIASFEAEVGYQPIKVALWGVAAASVLGAAAAGLGAVAAGAGAYVALRAAQRARHEHAAADLAPVPAPSRSAPLTGS